MPIFDNNNSLLPRFIEGYDTFSRKDYTVFDWRKFEDLYSLVRSHKDYTDELQKLKKFVFREPENVQIKEERLEFLNWFLQMQVEYLLSL